MTRLFIWIEIDMTPYLYVDGDSNKDWPVASSDSSSASWMAGSIDWGYESDETDPEVIFSAPDHIDHEEIESQASNEPKLTIPDTESLVGDSLEVGDTSAIKGREPKRIYLWRSLLG